jgi:hypothetical protein
LGPIKADLTRTDSKWQEFGFDDLLTTLRDFTLRNPENAGSNGNDKNGRRPPRGENRGSKCVYCNSTNHRCSDCDKVKDVSEREKFYERTNFVTFLRAQGMGRQVARVAIVGNVVTSTIHLFVL